MCVPGRGNSVRKPPEAPESWREPSGEDLKTGAGVVGRGSPGDHKDNLDFYFQSGEKPLQGLKEGINVV